MLQARECAPIPFLSDVFFFGLTTKSIKELGGASIALHLLPSYNNYHLITIAFQQFFLE
jgi:hypothetical protein